jgi:hypothetical protein
VTLFFKICIPHSTARNYFSLRRNYTKLRRRHYPPSNRAAIFQYFLNLLFLFTPYIFYTPVLIIRLSFIITIEVFIYGSIALVDLGCFFQFLNPYTVGRTPWTGDQPVARPLPAHRTTQTHRDTHASSRIRTHDPSIRAGEDGSCLRRRGHCVRLTSGVPAGISIGENLTIPISSCGFHPSIDQFLQVLVPVVHFKITISRYELENFSKEV